MARKTSNRTKAGKSVEGAPPVEDAEVVADIPTERDQPAPEASLPEGREPERAEASVADPEPVVAAPEALIPEGSDPETPPADPGTAAVPVADPEPLVSETVMPAPEEPAAPAAEPVASAPPPRPASAGPLVFGGFVAAVLGALAVLVLLPNGWRGAAAPDTALAERVAALEARGGAAADLGPLEARIAALEGAASVAPDNALADRVAALEGREAPALDLAPLEQRLAALEGAAPADPAAAIDALGARIDALEAGIDTRIVGSVAAALADARAAIDARADTLDAREEDVAAAQQRIAERAALAELVAAAESGAPSPGALATLGDVPAALRVMAEGLPTLAEVQASFAPNARRALAADPVAPGASLGERVTDFLRAQTGARSLAPREGDDTDAILSRAEARVRAGDLAGALVELDAISAAPAAEMAAWRGSADARLEALAALSALQAQMDNGE